MQGRELCIAAAHETKTMHNIEFIFYLFIFLQDSIRAWNNLFFEGNDHTKKNIPAFLLLTTYFKLVWT